MVLAGGWVLVCSVYFFLIPFLYSDNNMLDVLKRNGAKNPVDKMGVDEMGVNLGNIRGSC